MDRTLMSVHRSNASSLSELLAKFVDVCLSYRLTAFRYLHTETAGSVAARSSPLSDAVVFHPPGGGGAGVH